MIFPQISLPNSTFFLIKTKWQFVEVCELYSTADLKWSIDLTGKDSRLRVLRFRFLRFRKRVFISCSNISLIFFFQKNPLDALGIVLCQNPRKFLSLFPLSGYLNCKVYGNSNQHIIFFFTHAFQ